MGTITELTLTMETLVSRMFSLSEAKRSTSGVSCA